MTTDVIPFRPASSQNGVPRRLLIGQGISVGSSAEIRNPKKTPARAAAPAMPKPNAPTCFLRILPMSATSTNATSASTAGTATRFPFPNRNVLLPSSAIANSGRYVFGFRFRKSKIIVRPGERPVEKVDHDTGVWAGIVGVSAVKPPFAASAARFGSRPSATPLATSAWSAPSKPRTMTRGGAAARERPGKAKSAAVARTAKRSGFFCLGTPHSSARNRPARDRREHDRAPEKRPRRRLLAEPEE